MDYNGNGKRDAYTEPIDPADPTKDCRVLTPFDGDSPSPVTTPSGVWCTACRVRWCAWFRVRIPRDRADRGLRGAVEQPEGFGTGLCAARHGRRQQRRGVDGALERPPGELRSPEVQGPAERSDRHRPALPRGLDALSTAGTELEGSMDAASADSAYHDFVDRFDMLGVGKDVTLVTGNLSEGLLALVDGRFLTFRMPYPLGFFAKGLDGRIDDPKAGWKGKGIRTTSPRARRSTPKADATRPASW